MARVFEVRWNFVIARGSAPWVEREAALSVPNDRMRLSLNPPLRRRRPPLLTMNSSSTNEFPPETCEVSSNLAYNRVAGRQVNRVDGERRSHGRRTRTAGMEVSAEGTRTDISSANIHYSEEIARKIYD